MKLKQKLQNRRWDDAHFVAERGPVLTSWPTGVEVDLAEAFAYHQGLPESKKTYFKLRAGLEEGRIFLQPRAGVALLSEHLVLLNKLELEGQADFLPTTIDSYTRQNRYEEAQKGIEESKLAGRSLLNGFPAVNYGVANCRKIIEAAGVPVQIRHGTPMRVSWPRSPWRRASAISRGVGSPTTSPTPGIFLSRSPSTTGNTWTASAAPTPRTTSSSTARCSAPLRARWCRRASPMPWASSRRSWRRSRA